MKVLGTLPAVLVALALALVGVPFAQLVQPAEPASPAGIGAPASHEPPLAATHLELGSHALEPMVQFAPDGTIFYTALAGPVMFVVPSVLRSTDGGATWEDVTPRTLGLAPDPEYTMDPYLHVDNVTGRVFVSHYYPPGLLLGGIAPAQVFPECQVIAWSDDNGETWDESSACPGYDHQTLFTGPPPAGVETEGYPNVVYLCENSMGGNCRSSLDGGATWGERVRVWPDCGPQMGHGAVGGDGTVYVPRLACEFTFVAGSAPREGAELAISRDAGATWEIVVVDDTVGVHHFDMTTENDQVHHDAYVSVDDAGVVHYFFLDGESMPRALYSTDQGRTWSEPRLLAPEGVRAARLGVMVAGSAHHLAYALVGTDRSWHEDMTFAEWHAWLGVEVDGALQWTRATREDDPLRRGACHARCPGSHPAAFGMYDFANIAIHPQTGMAWASLMDMCRDGCEDTTLDPTYDHPRGALAVQTEGPRIRFG